MQARKTERNRLLILSALNRQTGPTTSIALAGLLKGAGHELSERSIRLYLRELEAEGMTRSLGRRGRLITELGQTEVRAAQVLERVGYLSAKIDQMTYRMTFDLQTRSGLVVVNTAFVAPHHLEACLDRVCQVFVQGYAVGDRVTVLGPGESIGGRTVPPDRVGVCTVCSITVNGVLLKHGVPTTSRFGGLLQLRDGQPARFVEMIHYDGTSIDPLEAFIRAGMTDYHGAIRDGNGLVGASFREMPEASRELVVSLAERLKAIGLGAFMHIGLPGQPVLGLPVSEGRFGAVIIGGLNPFAILEETGHRIDARALADLLEYNRLFPCGELPARLAALR